jgi:hypothetical protein
MRTITKFLFFLILLGFVSLSFYALIGNMSIIPTEYQIEVEIDKN